MKTIFENENWEIGWTEVGNYKFTNKNNETSLVVPRDIINEAIRE